LHRSEVVTPTLDIVALFCSQERFSQLSEAGDLFLAPDRYAWAQIHNSRSVHFGRNSRRSLGTRR
jgi:hypothetical protein